MGLCALHLADIIRAMMRDHVADVLTEVIDRLRAISPLGKD